jgi:hypothetical protein
VVRVLERIAADLDNLGLVSNDRQADKEANQSDSQARHRRELAEPSRAEEAESPRVADCVASGAGTTARVRKETVCSEN